MIAAALPLQLRLRTAVLALASLVRRVVGAYTSSANRRLPTALAAGSESMSLAVCRPPLV
jgi:hypothetical protein